ncbi:MAG TPA: DUF6726 family protein [Stellaceae bacterium]|nr:DUF6726 family protein [Stellaceae bacterium]
MRIMAVLICLCVSACSVVAAPCRISAAVIKTVPLIGKPVATPFDACADAID